MIAKRCAFSLLMLLMMTAAARPQISTLIDRGERTPLIQVNRISNAVTTPSSSVTILQSRRSPRVPYPARIIQVRQYDQAQDVSEPIALSNVRPLQRTTSSEAPLLQLIASAEAGSDGYDAIQHGARIRPIKRPTDMTIGEIYDWIVATPGQPHAIGRYQFIPDTLRRVVSQAGFDQKTQFSPAIQDQLAEVLLAEAGLVSFQTGALTRHGFMHNLAKIWAGLPMSNGKSYYQGYAGNHATITWARYDREMRQIYPG